MHNQMNNNEDSHLFTHSHTNQAESSANITLAKNMRLNYEERFFSKSVPFELIKDSRFEDGYYYQSVSPVSSDMITPIQAFNRSSIKILGKRILAINNHKIIVSINTFLAWKKKSEETFKIHSTTKARRIPLMIQFMDKHAQLEGWYKIEIQTPYARALKYAETAKFLFGMPATTKLATYNNILTPSSSEHDFVFYHDTSSVFVNEKTALSWNRMLTRYPDIKSWGAYSAKARVQQGSQKTSDVLTYIERHEPHVLKAYGQWHSETGNSATPNKVDIDALVEKLGKGFITEKCKENQNWFELRVPHLQTFLIAKQLMLYAIETYGLVFSSVFQNGSFMAYNWKHKAEIAMMLNANDNENLYIYPDTDLGRLLFSTATARAWNLAVEKTWHPECNTHVINNGIAEPLATQTAINVVDNLPIEIKPRRPKTREEMEAENQRRNYERALEIYKPTPQSVNSSSTSTPTRKRPGISIYNTQVPTLFTQTSKAPAINSKNGATFILHSNVPLDKFTQSTRDYLKSIEGELKANAYLIHSNTTDDASTMQFRDALTNKVVEVPVKFNNQLYDLRTLIDILENRRPNSIGIKSYEDILAGAQELEEMKAMYGERMTKRFKR